MTKTQALAYFKTRRKMAQALDLAEHSINNWPGDTIPPIHQVRLEAITGGDLRADDEAWSPASPRFSTEFFATTGRRKPFTSPA